MVPAAIICGLLLCFSSASKDGFTHPAQALVSPVTVNEPRDASRYLVPIVAPLVRTRPGNPFVSSDAAPFVQGKLTTATSRVMSTAVVIGPGFQTLPAKRPKRSA